MYLKNLGLPVTKAILSVTTLCVLSLPLQAEAQEYDWISQQPAMTYTSSVTSYAPAVISSQPIYDSAVIYNGQSTFNQTATTYSPSVYSAPSAQQFNSPSSQPGLAQSKADQAAQRGLRGHLGGGLGGAKYEGVGWSNQSPQDAIEHCCYWGTRPTAQIGVSKGQDGFWYACVLYY